MPYIGGSVTSFFDEGAQAVTHDLVRDMVDVGGDTIKDWAEKNTPVKTGKLRASWKKGEMIDADDAVTISVETDVKYAPFVENGTGLYGPKHAKYLIKPKAIGGTLKFEIDGRIVFAKFVMHPGSPGNHMMSIALNVTDALAQDGGIFDPVLDKWVKAMEAEADKQA
jgi:HK97 gp10 family phage protein